MNDYEIYKSIKMEDIKKVAAKLGLDEDDITLYGKYKAKIENKDLKKEGKLILITSTNPTPYGEGKTTLAIGLSDVLNKNGYKTVLALREPSLGPVFGTKGGACGGGYSQVVPMDEINLHFTGDMHAITSANNLISSVIDNHIYQGNELKIKEVYFERCLDLNDRALRDVELKTRKDHFNITAASEVMAVFSLATSLKDLEERIGNILVGINDKNEEIYVRDLKCEGAATALLKEAFKPNLVQTIYHNPAIIHGGPFANIAHGCSSIISIKTALSLGDYVITEAGFGSDMGAVKFFDIVCDNNNIYPNLVIVNSTIRSLKYNGEDSLEKGIENLKYHILNMQKFSDNVLVIINRFKDDQDEDINYVKDYVKSLGCETLVSNIYFKGEDDDPAIADIVANLANKEITKKYNIYNKEDDILTKIDKICKDIYYVNEIKYEEKALLKLKSLSNKYNDYKICVSKTQYSITDDPKKLGFPKNNVISIRDIKINNGAKFITVLTGKLIAMPGLSKKANYLNIKVSGDEILGIF